MNWDLSRLYAGFDDPKLAADFDAADALAKALTSHMANASRDDERAELVRAVRLAEELSAVSARAGSMVVLSLAADVNDQDAQRWYDRAVRVDVNVEVAMSAWARYVGDTEDFDAVISSDPLLTQHEYLFTLLKARALHTPEPAIESALLQMQMTGGHAWEHLRSTLDATHTVHYDLAGDVRDMPLSEARNLALSSDGAVRKAAYDAEIASYKAIEIPMAEALNAIKGEALTMAGFTHYDSVLDETLDQAHISREVLDAMISAIEEALPVFRKYLRLKARALGHANGLPFYDLFAPLGAPGETHTLESARALMTDVLGAFSPDMGALVDRAFDERWIDACPRSGKQGGAFCASAYPLGISYILSNFDGTLTSVLTLAHELGHAYHNHQLYRNPILLSDAPMTLAETASIFNETLMTQTLLNRATGDARLFLLDQELTEATQTVVDILSRYYFETAVLDARKTRSLSHEDFKRMMLDAQKKAYAGGLDPDFMHPYMWACKSHYYSPSLHFYNFPYAFGLLFGKGIYALFNAQPKDASSRYDDLLKQTALGDAESVAQSVGIDLTDRAFWQSSLNVIAEAVERFEAEVGA